MEINIILSRDRGLIRNFFDEVPYYKPYSRLRLYNDTEKINNYYNEVYFGDKKTKILVAFAENKVAGLAAWRISDWDTDVFGFKMGHIHYVAATGGYEKECIIKNMLLKEIMGLARKARVKLMSLRVDAADFSSIHALEGQAFKIMDNLVTYITQDTRIKDSKMFLSQVKNWFSVKPMKRKHIHGALHLIGEYFKTSHYSNDPHIPLSRTKAMYEKWLETKFRDRRHSDLFVATRNNRIVACSIFSSDQLLARHCALKSLHKGLVVVAPEGSGALMALVHAQIEKRPDLDFAEFETQGNNYKMLEATQKLGMRCIQSRYTFHKVL